MEQEHQDLIRTNFEFLVNNCKSDQLLSRIQSKLSISSEEYSELDAIKDKKSQCRALFTFLLNRGPNAFDAIINSLLETNQATVLNKLINPNALNDSAPTIQHAETQNIQFNHQRAEKVCIEPEYYIDELNEAVLNIVNVGAQEKPLEIYVKVSSNFDYEAVYQKKQIPFYKTTSRNRGLVKIINIVEVKGKPCRRGSVVDVKNLDSLFSQMGFQVDVFDTLALQPIRQNVLRSIQAFVTDERLKTADIAIMFIMSHGGRYQEKDYIFDCDGHLIYLNEIEQYFRNDKCPLMQNKPKLCFIQACRGEMADFGVRRVETDSHVHNGGENAFLPASNNYMPTQTDFLLAHSTVIGTASHRDPEVGTWFIYYICEVFMNHAHEKDVKTMLMMVYEKLRFERTVDGGMQVGEFTPRTFRACFLNPGIYRQGNQVCSF